MIMVTLGPTKYQPSYNISDSRFEILSITNMGIATTLTFCVT